MFPWASKQKGFTIVELLIVIVVIAILAAITIVAYNGIQNRAKESSSQSASAQAAKKVAAYAVDNADLFPVDKAALLAAALLPEASGSGAGITQGSTYQYRTTSDRKTYCLTTTTNGISFYTTNASQTPTKGACTGHGANGTEAIANLSNNPGSEQEPLAISTTSSGATSVRVTSDKFSGAASTLLTKGSSATYVATSDPTLLIAPVGETVRMSARVKSSATVVGIARRCGGVNCFGSQGQTLTPDQWTQITTTYVVPTGATSFHIQIGWEASTVANGTQIYVDNVMVTTGSTLYAYADGTSPGWAWTGDPNISTSTGPAL